MLIVHKNTGCQVKWVSRVLCRARHITGDFGDVNFQTITYTGTNKQTTKHTKQTKYSNPMYHKQSQENTKTPSL